MPQKNSKHTNKGIDSFLTSFYDDLIPEYARHFQHKFSEFESKLDKLKSEVNQTLTKKNPCLSTNRTLTVSTLSNENENNVLNSLHTQTDLDGGASDHDDLQALPSVKSLQKMGVKNYKPSIKHLINKNQKIHNICKNPNLCSITPRVRTGLNSV